MVALVTSCGSSSSSTATPTITVSCTPTDVTVLTTSQCTATVLNLSSTLVNWSISPSTAGNIDTQSGLYTAPATVPTNNVVTVTATSQVQSTVTATQNLTIEQATAIDHVTCVDPNTNIAPSPLVVSSNSELDCTALTTANATVAVNWTVSNATSGLAGNVGSISSQGIYKAPLVPPPGGEITITATSQAVPTITCCSKPPTTVSVVFGSAVLSGNFVFSTSGRLPTGAFWARTGSFSAGGGSINGGVEDTNQSGTPNTVISQRSFRGAYSVGADGRGVMQFCENAGPGTTSPPPCPFGSGAATAFFRFVVVSPQQIELIEFSNFNSQSAAATTVAGGEMILQDSSVAGAEDQNLFGVYSFGFSGVSSSGSAESAAGEFSANGFGTISAGSASAPGQMDIDAGGPSTLAATTYAVTSGARGQVTLNGLTFSFYPISASRAKFIEIDPVPPSTTASSILLGDSYKQQTSTSCGWSTNISLAGPTVLETFGSAAGFPVANVGAFTATNGAVSSASMDQNNAGRYSQPPGNGNYAMDASQCGRGTLSVAGHSYVLYIISPSNAVLQETTSGTTAHGLLLPAQSGSLADGSYAFRMQATDAAGAAGQEEDLLGQFTSATTKTGTAWNGTLDQNDFGATQTGLAITSGAYTSSSGLRSTATLPIAISPATTRNLVLYMVSPTLFYVLDTDATGTALGIIGNQF